MYVCMYVCVCVCVIMSYRCPYSLHCVRSREAALHLSWACHMTPSGTQPTVSMIHTHIYTHTHTHTGPKGCIHTHPHTHYINVLHTHTRTETSAHTPAPLRECPRGVSAVCVRLTHSSKSCNRPSLDVCGGGAGGLQSGASK